MIVPGVPAWARYGLTFAAGALAAGMVLGWKHEAELQRIAAAQASAQLTAELQARHTERTWQNRLDEVATDAQTTLAAARADAGAASAASDRLSKRAADYAARLSACVTATPGGSAAAGPSPVVLADVLGRVDAAAGELAAAYDDARARGLACQRSYGAIRAAAAVRPVRD